MAAALLIVTAVVALATLPGRSALLAAPAGDQEVLPERPLEPERLELEQA